MSAVLFQQFFLDGISQIANFQKYFHGDVNKLSQFFHRNKMVPFSLTSPDFMISVLYVFVFQSATLCMSEHNHKA